MAAASEQTFAAMFDKTTTKCDINSGTSMMLYQIGIFNALKASQLTSLGKYNEFKDTMTVSAESLLNTVSANGTIDAVGSPQNWQRVSTVIKGKILTGIPSFHVLTVFGCLEDAVTELSVKIMLDRLSAFIRTSNFGIEELGTWLFPAVLGDPTPKHSVLELVHTFIGFLSATETILGKDHVLFDKNDVIEAIRSRFPTDDRRVLETILAAHSVDIASGSSAAEPTKRTAGGQFSSTSSSSSAGGNTEAPVKSRTVLEQLTPIFRDLSVSYIRENGAVGDQKPLGMMYKSRGSQNNMQLNATTLAKGSDASAIEKIARFASILVEWTKRLISALTFKGEARGPPICITCTALSIATNAHIESSHSCNSEGCHAQLALKEKAGAFDSKATFNNAHGTVQNAHNATGVITHKGKMVDNLANEKIPAVNRSGAGGGGGGGGGGNESGGQQRNRSNRNFERSEIKKNSASALNALDGPESSDIAPNGIFSFVAITDIDMPDLIEASEYFDLTAEVRQARLVLVQRIWNELPVAQRPNFGRLVYLALYTNQDVVGDISNAFLYQTIPASLEFMYGVPTTPISFSTANALTNMAVNTAFIFMVDGGANMNTVGIAARDMLLGGGMDSMSTNHSMTVADGRSVQFTLAIELPLQISDERCAKALFSDNARNLLSTSYFIRQGAKRFLVHNSVTDADDEVFFIDDRQLFVGTYDHSDCLWKCDIRNPNPVIYNFSQLQAMFN